MMERTDGRGRFRLDGEREPLREIESRDVLVLSLDLVLDLSTRKFNGGGHPAARGIRLRKVDRVGRPSLRVIGFKPT